MLYSPIQIWFNPFKQRKYNKCKFQNNRNECRQLDITDDKWVEVTFDCRPHYKWKQKHWVIRNTKLIFK